MDFHGDYILLWQLTAFLAAAVVVLLAAARLKLSPIISYLLLGIAAGPQGIALVETIDTVETVGELGVAFLLFTIGLELSFERLRSMARDMLSLGGLQVLITGGVFSAAAYIAGNAWLAAVIIGGGMALSSTAVVMDSLERRREDTRPTGRTAFSILLFQDLAVVLLLVLATLPQEQADAAALAVALAKALAAVGGIIVFGRLVLRPLFHFIGAHRSPELFLAMSLLTVASTAVAAEEAGLSAGIGAFLAGLVLAETEYRHRIEVDIEPFRGLLLGVFFVSVGMQLDPAVIWREANTILAMMVPLFLVKGAILYGLVRLFRRGKAHAVRVSMLLAASGEFALLLIGAAAAVGSVAPVPAQILIAAAALSMLFIPPLDSVSRRWARRIQRKSAQVDLAAPDEDIQQMNQHVIVAGFGRLGARLASRLADYGYPIVGIDINARRVGALRRHDAEVIYGDARREGALEHAGLERARALVIAVRDSNDAAAIIGAATRRRADLPIVVRAPEPVPGDWLDKDTIRPVSTERLLARAMSLELRDFLEAEAAAAE